MDLALNNPQWLICHKINQNLKNTKLNKYQLDCYPIIFLIVMLSSQITEVKYQ